MVTTVVITATTVTAATTVIMDTEAMAMATDTHPTVMATADTVDTTDIEDTTIELILTLA